MTEVEKQIEELRKRLDLLVMHLGEFEKDEILSLSQELDKVLNVFIEQKQINDK
ncbi:MAG: Spo0E family sporulation regulatory protein-aspartic acid phosphatase [Clostridiales bacterium]|mgnify:CR=1 FL=1|nr:Spo0E family sporulation regulatory protein-aspartic acid phosphatase [Clostridiales bacterium]